MHRNVLILVASRTKNRLLHLSSGGANCVVELERWATQLWFEFGIFLIGDNRNFLIANDSRRGGGPNDAA